MKIGCTEVWKEIFASGVPVGLFPNSIRRKSRARTVNSLPSISLPSSVIPPFSFGFLHGNSLWRQSLIVHYLDTLAQPKKVTHRQNGFFRNEIKKRSVTSPVTARSGTIATPSFLSRDNCDSTSNVRILSTSSPKSQYDKDIPKQTKRRQ